MRPNLGNEQLYKKIKCKIILVQYRAPILRLKYALVSPCVWNPDPVGSEFTFFNWSDLEKCGSGSENRKKRENDIKSLDGFTLQFYTI